MPGSTFFGSTQGCCQTLLRNTMYGTLDAAKTSALRLKHTQTCTHAAGRKGALSLCCSYIIKETVVPYLAVLVIDVSLQPVGS